MHLATKGPATLTVFAGAACVGNEGTPEADPKKKPDQRTIAFTEGKQLISNRSTATKDVYAASRNFAINELSVKPPIRSRKEPGCKRILPVRTNSERDVCLAPLQYAKELRRKLNWFLKVCGHHREIGRGCGLKTLADRGKGARGRR